MDTSYNNASKEKPSDNIYFCGEAQQIVLVLSQSSIVYLYSYV